jgi:hypothetical protein
MSVGRGINLGLSQRRMEEHKIRPIDERAPISTSENFPI